jgi:hypothetical protein
MQLNNLLLASLLPTLLLAHALPNTPSSKNNDNDDGNTGCLSWCRSNFHSPTSDCVAPARSHGGPCFDCGPQASKHKRDSSKKIICKERCCDANSDDGNCGRCGNAVRHLT